MLDSRRSRRYGPSGFQVAPRLVRIRPRERVAVTGAGPALVGLRGPAEVRARVVASVWLRRSRRAVSAATGLPTRTADRDREIAAAPLLASRAPSGHAGGSTPAEAGRHPPGLFAPSARVGAADPVTAGVADARHLPSSAFRRPRRLSLRDSAPSLSAWERSWGSRLQGLHPLEEPHASRRRCSLAVRAASPEPRSSGSAELGFRALLSSRIRAVPGRNPERPFPS
jgi:hypothetical protein